MAAKAGWKRADLSRQECTWAPGRPDRGLAIAPTRIRAGKRTLFPAFVEPLKSDSVTSGRHVRVRGSDASALTATRYIDACFVLGTSAPAGNAFVERRAGRSPPSGAWSDAVFAGGGAADCASCGSPTGAGGALPYSVFAPAPPTTVGHRGVLLVAPITRSERAAQRSRVPE